jgi:hypothetical protein
MNDTSGTRPAAEGPDSRAKGSDHTLGSALDHPDATQPFGGGPLPDYVTELAPGDHLLEMPDPGPEAEPF